MVLTLIDPLPALSRWFQARGASSGGGDKLVGTAGEAPFAAYYTVTGDYPQVQLSTYQLRVEGAVAHPLTLSWRELQAVPRYHETANFQCVTGWSVPNVRWNGVHISELVKRVKPQESVKFVHFYSFDGAYSECLQLSEALDPTVLLADSLDGQPLPVPQGHPLRLVVPKMYGYKSIKWVNRIEFSATPITGYWEERGYSTEAYF